jgi:hypothetical protein
MVKWSFAWAALIALAPAAAFAQQPVKVSIEIENLSKEQGDRLRGALSGLAGVGEIAVAGGKVTISLKEEATLKLSEIEAKLAELKQDPEKKLKILVEKIRLIGRVEISCTGDDIKLHGALKKIAKLKDLSIKGAGVFACSADSSGVTVGEIVKAIAKAGANGEAESEAAVTDLTWFGPPKPDAKPKPDKKPGKG